MIKILVLLFYLKDIFGIHMYALVTLAHIQYISRFLEIMKTRRQLKKFRKKKNFVVHLFFIVTFFVFIFKLHQPSPESCS